jgi:P27 family predicted phage terminase small subunit
VGQRGPKPKPAALKIVPGGRPAGRRVRRGIPDRPPELTGEAAREWDRIVPELDGAGLLAVADRGILAAYCCAVADMLAARDAINRNGRFLTQPVQTSRGERLGTRTVEHPAVKLLDRASSRVKVLGEALGLTPASRARLQGEEPAEAPAGGKLAEIRARIQAARNGG